MPANRSRIRRKAPLLDRPEQKQSNLQNSAPVLSPEEEVSASNSAEVPGSPQTALRRVIAAPPRAIQPSDVLTLQRTLGNQAVGRLIQGSKSKRGGIAPRPVSPPIIQRVLLMKAETFSEGTGHLPEELVKLCEPVIRLLKNYHSILEGLWLEVLDQKFYNTSIRSKYSFLLMRVVEELKPVFAELKEKTDQAYNQKKEKIKIPKLDKGYQKLKEFHIRVNGLVELVDKRLLVPTELKDLEVDIDAFLKEQNQLNVDKFIENNPEKILSQEDLDPGSVQSNVEGGNINKVGMGTYLPRPGGPIEAPLTGYTKTGLNEEGEENLSDPGKGSGIPVQDPRAALRAVATYKLSELIGLDIIPRTVLTKFTNQEGKQRLGQVMEKVSGSSGQSNQYVDLSQKLEEGEKKQQILQAFAVLKNPEANPQALKEAKETVVGKFSEFGGEVYKNAAEGTITNFDWDNPVIQKDLSTLQIFDLIIGHVDRHAGNLIVNYDPNDKNNVFGVKGIDNDDVMGRNFINPADPSSKGQGVGGISDISKTPGLPPVLDFSVALKLLNTKWEDIANELTTYTLPEPEIEAARMRWDVVIEHVISLVMNNSLAYLGDPPDKSQLFRLRSLMQRQGRVWVPSIELLKQWGTEGTTSLLTSGNSYSGDYRERRQQTQPNYWIMNEPQYKA